MMVVQGSNEPIVPLSESEQMVAALRARGQTVWYMDACNAPTATPENKITT